VTRGEDATREADVMRGDSGSRARPGWRSRRTGPPPRAHVRLVRLLAWDYLAEVGATTIYRVQAGLVRGPACREALRRIGSQEAEHAEHLLKMWGRPAWLLRVLGWPCRLVAAGLGVVSGLAGWRKALRMDLDLERRGIALYEETLDVLRSLGPRPDSERVIEIALEAERGHRALLEGLLTNPTPF